MNKEEIEEYIRKCPYSDKSIDTKHTCDLEFNYNKICPSKIVRVLKNFIQKYMNNITKLFVKL